MSYYDILEVDRSADQTIIKKAYILLSKKYHPDKLSPEDKVVGEEKFKLIGNAYAILSDEEKRKVYDLYGEKGLENMEHRKTHTDDIKEISVTVALSLEKIYNGTSTNITFQRVSNCTICDGNGTKDKQTHFCNSCKGTGNIRQPINLGFLTQYSNITCTSCYGRGIKNGYEFCHSCFGKIKLTENYTTKIDIPKGSITTKLFGIGHEVKGVGRGNVIVNISQKDHPVFKRSRFGLTTTIEISLAESLCGFKKHLIHLDGRKLAIIMDDIVKDGDVKAIMKEGLTHGDITGDLIITFIVVDNLPLTLRQKQIIYSALTEEELPINTLTGDDEVEVILEDFSDEIFVSNQEHGVQNCPMQ